MAKPNQKTATRNGGQLDARLNDYSAVTRISAAAKSVRSRVGNWPIYAAAAGSALAMATSASASIITGTYSGNGPNGGASVQSHNHASSIKGLFLGISHTTTTFAHGHIKMVPDEINIIARGGAFATLSVSGVAPVVKIFEAATTSVARKFSAGSKIPGTAGVAGFNVKIVASVSGIFGDFASGQPGYVGFSVNVGGGNADYGWLKLEFTDNSDHVPQILEALAFGVDTNPNESFEAGEVAPEPGTMALSLLAAGAVGVGALRRRRRQTQTTAPVV
jgi:hypothetical protein